MLTPAGVTTRPDTSGQAQCRPRSRSDAGRRKFAPAWPSERHSRTVSGSLLSKVSNRADSDRNYPYVVFRTRPATRRMGHGTAHRPGRPGGGGEGRAVRHARPGRLPALARGRPVARRTRWPARRPPVLRVRAPALAAVLLAGGAGE